VRLIHFVPVLLWSAGDTTSNTSPLRASSLFALSLACGTSRTTSVLLAFSRAGLTSSSARMLLASGCAGLASSRARGLIALGLAGPAGFTGHLRAGNRLYRATDDSLTKCLSGITSWTSRQSTSGSLLRFLAEMKLPSYVLSQTDVEIEFTERHRSPVFQRIVCRITIASSLQHTFPLLKTRQTATINIRRHSQLPQFDANILI